MSPCGPSGSVHELDHRSWPFLLEFPRGIVNAKVLWTLQRGPDLLVDPSYRSRPLVAPSSRSWRSNPVLWKSILANPMAFQRFLMEFLRGFCGTPSAWLHRASEVHELVEELHSSIAVHRSSMSPRGPSGGDMSPGRPSGQVHELGYRSWSFLLEFPRGIVNAMVLWTFRERPDVLVVDYRFTAVLLIDQA